MLAASFALVLGFWVWASFISDEVAPFGLKLVGTTCTALLLLVALDWIWAEVTERNETRARLLRPRRDHIARSLQNDIWIKSEGRCQWRVNGVVCGRRNNLEIDHIVPVSKGGKNTWANLQLLCREHNRFKGARDHEPPEDTAADIPAVPPNAPPDSDT